MADRVGKGERNCISRDGEAESPFHIFKECHFFRMLAFASTRGLRFDSLPVNSIEVVVLYSPHF